MSSRAGPGGGHSHHYLFIILSGEKPGHPSGLGECVLSEPETQDSACHRDLGFLMEGEQKWGGVGMVVESPDSYDQGLRSVLLQAIQPLYK